MNQCQSKIPNKTVLYPSIKLEARWDENTGSSNDFSYLPFSSLSIRICLDNASNRCLMQTILICDLIKVAGNTNMHRECYSITFTEKKREAKRNDENEMKETSKRVRNLVLFLQRMARNKKMYKGRGELRKLSRSLWIQSRWVLKIYSILFPARNSFAYDDFCKCVSAIRCRRRWHCVLESFRFDLSATMAAWNDEQRQCDLSWVSCASQSCTRLCGHLEAKALETWEWGTLEFLFACGFNLESRLLGRSWLTHPMLFASFCCPASGFEAELRLEFFIFVIK